MRTLTLAAMLIAVCLGGCGAEDSPDSKRNGLTGSDRDAHGCIPSAGYRWCERTNQCERPWELAKEKGFENTREQFDAYCEG
jgi:hypothetical protein